MPNTYQLIASNVVSSTVSSVTFSSISSTYTDLVLRWSVRSNRAGTQNASLNLVINSDTSSNYSDTEVTGNGSAAASVRLSNQTFLTSAYVNAATTTTNVFTSGEFYIPSYNVSANKPMSTFYAVETNATTVSYIAAVAGLWRNTATISSLSFTLEGPSSFVAGSSFYLYGIKNS